jgi:hypothetical protein
MNATNSPRPETSATIELAPNSRGMSRRVLHAIRVGARWAHLALSLAVVLGVFVQVYLIGAYIFGAGQGALDAHETVGFTVHGLEVLIFVTAIVAWLPRADLGLSLLLAVIGTVQVSLANGHRWVGGLHPLLALVVLILAAVLARRAIRRRRNQPQPEGERK